MNVIDPKPNNLTVTDTKTNNQIVLDNKPNNISGALAGGDQLYEQVLTQGMYMGIPPHTYAEAGTVVTSFSP